MSRHEDLTQQAREAFEDHVITRTGEGDERWLLQRLYSDGKPRSDFATEIVSLWGGALYVGGDIDHVIYARYQDDLNPRNKVRWMGAKEEVCAYVLEKANIGMGRPQLVWDVEEAKILLGKHILYLEEQQDTTLKGEIRDCRRLLSDVAMGDEYAVQEQLHEIDSDLPDLRCIAPPVYFTHAALRRLCEIWGG
jgi:hypothetical protein